MTGPTPVRKRYAMEQLTSGGWRVVDTLTGRPEVDFFGNDQDRQAFRFAVRANQAFEAEVRRAHEEALIDHAVWQCEHDTRPMSDQERRRNHDLRRARFGTCRSWRIHWGRWRPVISRCAWPADHVRYSKWHCAETTTHRVWLVGEHERERF